MIERQSDSRDERMGDCGIAEPSSRTYSTAVYLPLPFSVSSAVASERHLVALACALGAESWGGRLSDQEHALCADARAIAIPSHLVEEARCAIRAGHDPLGDALCRLRSGEQRRAAGAFYTPMPLVESMAEWLLACGIDRAVDPGCGSGRFAAYVARRRPNLPIVAIDADPVATLMTRAAMAVLTANAMVHHHDYLTADLPMIVGKTGFLGNPPYVRHHDLDAATKAWAVRTARDLGIPVSGLAGLHVLFYMKTAGLMRNGDMGCFVTSAEWLDVGYGEMLRRLLTERLSVSALALVAPDSDQVFDDALTTALVTGFKRGSRPGSVAVQMAHSAASIDLEGQSRVLAYETLAAAPRWGPLLRDEVVATAEHLVPLGRIARVHRGIATGANSFFVLTRERARDLGVLPWCHPAITRAEEILSSGGVIHNSPARRLLLMVPADIDRLAHPQLDAYLKQGEALPNSKSGNVSPAHSYLATHRTPWWNLGPARAPAIVASYMARQPPAFAYNPDGLVLLNIAHGIYPHKPFTAQQALALTGQLNEARSRFKGQGRTYHGGLEKFEPREMESLLVAVAAGE